MADMLKKWEESKSKDKSVQELSSNLKELKEKRRLSRRGWDVDESEEDLEKEIKDAAQLLREKHLEEVSQFGEPTDKEVFGALDELGIPHSEENVDMMTRRIQTEQQVMF